MKSQGRILSFDYGSIRIGIAVGNNITHTAQPLMVLDSGKHGPDWSRIIEIIDFWKPSALLVGLPLSATGEETSMSKKARMFAQQLGERSSLEVLLIDERYSTLEASDMLANLIKGGVRIRRQSSKTDDLAAQLILETYFSEIKEHAPSNHG